MTNPTVPTAAQALAAAWNMVTSAEVDELDVRRAEVLLGIATEIRQEQQFRTINQRRAAGKLEAAGIPAPASYAGESAIDRTARVIREAGYVERPAWESAATQVVNNDAGKTQAIPVLWTVGDKAQCRHCHTPIELHEVAVAGADAPPAVWRHRYTGQATCAVATMSGEPGAEATHTFAEPDPRG